MKIKGLIILVTLICFAYKVQAQEETKIVYNGKGYILPATIYKGDTIPNIVLRNVFVYPKMVFRNKKQEQYYWKLVRDVKKTLPIALEVKNMVIETYQFLETLPDKKSKDRHIKAVEKSIKEQYTPKMKKLTFAQGKLLIKLVNRECNQSSYELVKAFIGPFRAAFYQAFASLFGASLKKEYDPDDEDKMVERVVTLVQNGQL